MITYPKAIMETGVVVTPKRGVVRKEDMDAALKEQYAKAMTDFIVFHYGKNHSPAKERALESMRTLINEV